MANALSVLKYFAQQGAGEEVLHRFALPGEFRVKQLIRRTFINHFVHQGDNVGNRLAAVTIKQPPYGFSARRCDFAHIFAELNFGDDAVLCFNSGELIYATEHRIGCRCDEPLAHTEGIHLGALDQHIPNDIFI